MTAENGMLLVFICHCQKIQPLCFCGWPLHPNIITISVPSCLEELAVPPQNLPISVNPSASGSSPVASLPAFMLGLRVSSTGLSSDCWKVLCCSLYSNKKTRHAATLLSCLLLKYFSIPWYSFLWQGSLFS